jgi:hypothetical protein
MLAEPIVPSMSASGARDPSQVARSPDHPRLREMGDWMPRRCGDGAADRADHAGPGLHGLDRALAIRASASTRLVIASTTGRTRVEGQSTVRCGPSTVTSRSAPGHGPRCAAPNRVRGRRLHGDPQTMGSRSRFRPGCPPRVFEANPPRVIGVRSSCEPRRRAAAHTLRPPSHPCHRADRTQGRNEARDASSLSITEFAEPRGNSGRLW